MLCAACISGCSSDIDDKFVGQYLDEKYPSSYIQLNQDGSCDVRSGSGRNPSRKFWCSVNEPTISMKLMRDEIPNDEGVIYPEFRGNAATLTIDKDALITQTGRRFIKRGSSTSSSSTSSTSKETITISTPSSSSPSGTTSVSSMLTPEKAQDAIDRLAKADGFGIVRLTSGIQEIPAQNMARALVYFEQHDNPVPGRGRFFGAPGTVVFTRYNDGKWALTGYAVRLQYRVGPNYDQPGAYADLNRTNSIEVR